MSDADAIVIGSGAGGLTCALALARAGRRVLVLEQHDLPGGWTHTFRLGGHAFSPGVHYVGELGPGGGLKRLYEGLGVSRDLAFYELDPDGYDQVRVGRDVRFHYPRGFDALSERLQQRFPADREGIRRYLDTVRGVARGISGLAEPSLATAWRARHVLRHGLGSVDRLLRTCTADPVLRAVLAAQSGDYALPPSVATAALHASVQAHYFEGAWYPKGGGHAIPKAFLRGLRAHGGKIRLRTRVSRVILERGRAVGVSLEDGTQVRAPIVVSNADPHVTWNRLVGPEHTPWRVRRRLAKARWSVSAVSLFLAVDMDLEAAGLTSGNTWYLRDPDPEAVYRMGPDPLAGPIPGLFLTVTTLKDPSKRKDVHTCECFTFVSPEAFRAWEGTRQGERPAAYQDLKERLADRMLAAIDEIVPGFSAAVTFRAVGTPLTNAHYVEATDGNLYGLEKTLGNLGPMGFPLVSPIPGLYQCGQSTLSHGVLGASWSGLLAARAALGCRVRDLLDAGGPPVRTLATGAGDISDEAAVERAVG